MLESSSARKHQFAGGRRRHTSLSHPSPITCAPSPKSGLFADGNIVLYAPSARHPPLLILFSCTLSSFVYVGSKKRKKNEERKKSLYSYTAPSMSKPVYFPALFESSIIASKSFSAIVIILIRRGRVFLRKRKKKEEDYSQF